MAIHTQESLSGFIASEPLLTETAKGDARFFARIGKEHFRREDDGLWYGQVYVPDIDKVFDGTIEQVDRNTIVGTGCLFANFGCKSQTWKRVTK